MSREQVIIVGREHGWPSSATGQQNHGREENNNDECVEVINIDSDGSDDSNGGNVFRSYSSEVRILEVKETGQNSPLRGAGRYAGRLRKRAPAKLYSDFVTIPDFFELQLHDDDSFEQAIHSQSICKTTKEAQLPNWGRKKHRRRKLILIGDTSCAPYDRTRALRADERRYEKENRFSRRLKPSEYNDSWGLRRLSQKRVWENDLPPYDASLKQGERKRGKPAYADNTSTVLNGQRSYSKSFANSTRHCNMTTIKGNRIENFGCEMSLPSFDTGIFRNNHVNRLSRADVAEGPATTIMGSSRKRKMDVLHSGAPSFDQRQFSPANLFSFPYCSPEESSQGPRSLNPSALSTPLRLIVDLSPPSSSESCCCPSATKPDSATTPLPFWEELSGRRRVQRSLFHKPENGGQVVDDSLSRLRRGSCDAADFFPQTETSQSRPPGDETYVIREPSLPHGTDHVYLHSYQNVEGLANSNFVNLQQDTCYESGDISNQHESCGQLSPICGNSPAQEVHSEMLPLAGDHLGPGSVSEVADGGPPAFAPQTDIGLSLPLGELSKDSASANVTEFVLPPQQFSPDSRTTRPGTATVRQKGAPKVLFDLNELPRQTKKVSKAKKHRPKVVRVKKPRPVKVPKEKKKRKGRVPREETPLEPRSQEEVTGGKDSIDRQDGSKTQACRECNFQPAVIDTIDCRYLGSSTDAAGVMESTGQRCEEGFDTGDFRGGDSVLIQDRTWLTECSTNFAASTRSSDMYLRLTETLQTSMSEHSAMGTQCVISAAGSAFQTENTQTNAEFGAFNVVVNRDIVKLFRGKRSARAGGIYRKMNKNLRNVLSSRADSGAVGHADITASKHHPIQGDLPLCVGPIDSMSSVDGNSALNSKGFELLEIANTSSTTCSAAEKLPGDESNLERQISIETVWFDVVSEVVNDRIPPNTGYKPTGLEIVPHKKQVRDIVPYAGPVSLFKKKKSRAKVMLDPEDKRVWRLLMTNGTNFEDEENDTAKQWADERKVMEQRARCFIGRMHLVQGNRCFSRWKGSVVDSVVGAFLTQNVSDHLSSSAFMALAARFPAVKHTTSEAFQPGGGSKNQVHEASELCREESPVADDILQHDLVPCKELGRGETSGLLGGRQEKNSCNHLSRVLSNGNEQASSCADLTDETSRSAASTWCSYRNVAGVKSSCASQVVNGEAGSTGNVSQYTDSQLANTWNGSIGVQGMSQTSSHAEQGCSTCSESNLLVHASLNEVPEQKSSHCSQSLDTEGNGNVSTVRIDDTGGAWRLQRCNQCASRETTNDTLGEGRQRAQHTVNESSLSQYPNSSPCLDSPVEGNRDCNMLEGSQNGMFSMGLHALKTRLRQNNTKKGVSESDTSPAETVDLNAESFNTLNAELKLMKGAQTSSKLSISKLTGVARAKLEETQVSSKTAVDWESVRGKYAGPEKKDTDTRKTETSKTPATLPTVENGADWDAVRIADVGDIADVIKERGMNNVLAGRIKAFLERLQKEHGTINLEWLRTLSVEEAKSFLLSVRGLGLKSVECIRLLTLHHLAFPVDTNVGRICVRLGWVPLEPLPEALQIHLLELYPVQETIQKYLWPRLCTLDQPTLYELHYQMITFGKVFCTKSRPNCNSCPMQGECKHFASALASARLALPGPGEGVCHRKSGSLTLPAATEEFLNTVKLALPPAEQDYVSREVFSHFGKHSILGNQKHCEPIIEEPTTPEQASAEPLESDIEEWDCHNVECETYIQDSEGKTLPNIVGESPSMAQVIIKPSMALVALPPGRASIPVPQLKNIGRLRTVHYVYDLPDSHPLLSEMDRREPDDPSVYSLAIWSPGETPEAPLDSIVEDDVQSPSSCKNANENGAETVKGTLLVPCRTAMRGIFPLNGTYFQVNEVFADHASSLQPIQVPRALLWNLRRRFVYFGTSVTTIFRGLSTEEIQACFWRGYVCVRGFDSKSRAPRPLVARLHFPASKIPRKQKGGKAEEDDDLEN